MEDYYLEFGKIKITFFSSYFNFSIINLQCSVTCGRGIRRREVQCYRGRKNLVSDSECNPKTKLNSVANCFPVACPAYRWNVTPWSKVRVVILVVFDFVGICVVAGF